ncbi:hypothetical protein [Phormidesmis sp. 146-33]
MTSEALPTETEIDLDQLDCRDFAALDRETLEKIAAALNQKQDAIKEQNRDRLTEIKRLQFEVESDGQELPKINAIALAAKSRIEKLEIESNLIEDVKLLRPISDRINQQSRALYDLLAEYLTEVDRIQKLQKTVDFKAEFLLRVEPGDLPVVEHREGSNKFELKTVDAASYQRQNRASAFRDDDFGFADHRYIAKN